MIYRSARRDAEFCMRVLDLLEDMRRDDRFPELIKLSPIEWRVAAWMAEEAVNREASAA
jgi:hypothetical protein